MNEHDADTDEWSHLLGVYEIPDARALLAELEAKAIPFALEELDETAASHPRGTFGQRMRLRVWIHPADQARAEEIQRVILKVVR